MLIDRSVLDHADLCQPHCMLQLTLNMFLFEDIDLGILISIIICLCNRSNILIGGCI